MPRTTFEGYYTPAQTLEKLGINRKQLENYVNQGKLHRVTPPGRTHGVFAKDEVDDLAHELKAFIAISAAQKEPIRFVKGTPDDMEECAVLVKNIFGVRPNIERRRTWVEKNPDCCYIVKVSDKIVGLVFMLPLTNEKIQEIWNLEHSPPLYADDIQTFEPGKPAHLYILSMGVQPSSTLNRRLWGSRLIAGLMRTIIELGIRGIVIEDILARSEYPDGIELMKHIGFTEVPSATQQRNFIIRVAESGIPQVLEYKVALARSQGKQPPPMPKAPKKYPARTICPECGDLDNPTFTFERIGKSHHYHCSNCG
ncbi:MAG: hypothetical protein WCD86_16835, partial [Ktedonobacteraceae bacterium]